MELSSEGFAGIAFKDEVEVSSKQGAWPCGLSSA